MCPRRAVFRLSSVGFRATDRQLGFRVALSGGLEFLAEVVRLTADSSCVCLNSVEVRPEKQER
ncbi:MAG: hypothetical protein DWQ34_12965 [Planctomycetota bacterium]|nr:MAG: hypothetical protein DWQ34_12965 [Planctomycetota bacterium]REK34962.1 MAG: hypothetical protein DWQ45_12750 [Planctomycetota bacterium]